MTKGSELERHGRRTRNRPPVAARACRRLIAGASSLLIVWGCAPRAPDDVSCELAELRAEHRELRAELTRLRALFQRADPHRGSPEDDAPRAPESPQADRSTGPTIGGLLKAYESALERYDLAGLEREVYRGPIPTVDRRVIDLWLHTTDRLSLDLEPQQVQREADGVYAVVRQEMRYRLRRTGAERTVSLTVTMFFTSDGDGWRLRELRARR